MADLKHTISISEAEYRPCYVDGKKALFHKWEKKKTPIIKFNSYYSDEQLAVEIEKVILDARTNIYFQESDYGIVEYEDGTVAEVEPSKIKFVSGIMRDFCYDDIEYSKEQHDYFDLKKKYDGLSKNHKMLAKRFNHLLQSEYIRSFDEKKHGEYVRDISEATENQISKKLAGYALKIVEMYCNENDKGIITSKTLEGKKYLDWY